MKVVVIDSNGSIENGWTRRYFLSERIFDDLDAIVLLVGRAFVFDGVDRRAPIAVLRTIGLVDFDLQASGELVATVQLSFIKRISLDIHQMLSLTDSVRPSD